MRPTQAVVCLAALGVALLAGCGSRDQASTATSDSLLTVNPQETPQGSLTPQQPYSSQHPRAAAPRATTSIPSGTEVPVTIGAEISSESANAGDGWTGTVSRDVIVGRRVVIPAGSVVHGTVTAARSAQRGERAMLDLGVRSIEVDGRTVRLHGDTEAIVAGSTRARNLGAIAGSAAAGALIGRAVGGSGKGALIGGLIGGAAATGAVAKSKGYQVVVKPGTNIVFVSSEPVATRL